MRGSARNRSAKRPASRQQRSTMSSTPAASQLPQRRVHGEATRTAGRFRRPVHRLAGFLGTPHEVGRADAERRPVRRRMSGESETGVVRHVQPFVRVRRPRVGARHALHVMAQGATGACPQSERAVHVEPGPMVAAHDRRSPRTDRTRRCSHCPPERRRLWDRSPRPVSSPAHPDACAPGRPPPHERPPAIRCRVYAARR